jgi:DNA polymerase-1
MLVTSDDLFNELLAAMRASASIVVDLETNGLDPYNGNRLIGVAVRTEDERTWYAPYRHGSGYNRPLAELPALLSAIAEHPHSMGWNYKFDLQFMVNDGMPWPTGRVTDVMLYLHLANENEESFALKKAGAKYFGAEAAAEQTELYDKLASMGYKRSAAAGEMWRLPPEDVYKYAEQDVALTWKFYVLLLEGLDEWGLSDIALRTDKYMEVTTRMEYHGIKVDRERCEDNLTEATVQAQHYTRLLQEIAGYEINLNSPKQLGALLNVPSTAAKVLEDMYAVADEEERYPLRYVLDYRAWAKVGNTYYAKYLEKLDAQDVLHTSLNLHGTATGRLSSRNPNLHAIPRASEVYKVKDVFIARPGHTLVSIDYSQAELRLAAHYTQDKAALDAFVNGIDLHQMTADRAGITRQKAKNVNFGILYQIGPKALMVQLGCDYTEAYDTLEAVHAQFPGYRKLARKCERDARAEGFIRYWTGRVRRYDGRVSPYHKASANLIQGGVSEILATTILRLDALLPPSIKMLLQIHDQIIFEVPDPLVEHWLPRIAWVMEDLPFSVPFKVDVATGPRLGKKYLQPVDVERIPC